MQALNEEELKRNIADKTTWWRLPSMIVVMIAFYLAAGLLFALALLQFLVKLFTGRVLEGPLVFGANLATYLGQIAQYLSYTSQDRPFPFAPFPEQRTQILPPVRDGHSPT